MRTSSLSFIIANTNTQKKNVWLIIFPPLVWMWLNFKSLSISVLQTDTEKKQVDNIFSWFLLAGYCQSKSTLKYSCFSN